MTEKSTPLPASIQACFPGRERGIATRFEEDASFRELCRDFDEVVTNLANLDPADSLASELKLLASELESELLAELEPSLDGQSSISSPIDS